MVKDLCFEIIQKCPNNCRFCSSNSSIDATHTISLETFKNTLNHFLENGGIKEISISGGEPFLHPDLFKMIEFCKQNGIRTVIFTSGIKRRNNLSEEEIEALMSECKVKIAEIEEGEPWNTRAIGRVKKFYERILDNQEFSGISISEFAELKRIGVDKIVFDYQAAEEETYNKLMGTRQLMTAVMNSMVRARIIGHSVDVHFIPMKTNYRQFPDILECLEIAGIDNISLLNFVPQGRGRINKDELMLSDEEMREFASIYEKCRESFRGKIRVGIPLLGNVQHVCTAGTEKLNIKYDGTVLPCPAFKEIDSETIAAHGITLYNIYDNLQDISIPGGKRKLPLCREIYKFTGAVKNGGTDR